MSRRIQDNLNLVHMIIVKVDKEVVLINLDQFKALDKVDHCFLEVVLSMAGFKLYFCYLFASCRRTPMLWDKIEALHHVQIQVDGEPGPWQNHLACGQINHDSWVRIKVVISQALSVGWMGCTRYLASGSVQRIGS